MKLIITSKLVFKLGFVENIQKKIPPRYSKLKIKAVYCSSILATISKNMLNNFHGVQIMIVLELSDSKSQDAPKLQR